MVGFAPFLSFFAGNWAKALPERFGTVNNIIGYYVNRQGEVNISLNGEDLPGPFFTGVGINSPLWALVDIYGNATGVEFLGKRPSLVGTKCMWQNMGLNVTVLYH